MNRTDAAGHHPIGLDEVLVTAELDRRPSRPPDHAAENRALVALAEALADAPQTILQRLVDTALALCRADSAGISILEPDDGPGRFRWHAVAGPFAANVGGTMARDASPCGTVLDRDAALLFAHPARHFAGLAAVDPPIVENLLVPFHVAGQPVGTVWAIAHTSDRRFDAEDARLLASLSRFASVAYRMTGARTAAETGRDELERRGRTEEALRESQGRTADRTADLARANEALLAEVRDRVRAEQALTELLRRLDSAQEDERRRVARDLHDQVGQLLAGLALGVKAAEIAGPLPPPALAALGDVRRIADELGRQVHDLAVDLRPTALDDLGLPAALDHSLMRWSERTGIAVDLHCSGLVSARLAPAIETTIYRVVLEALNNVLKHARAGRVSVIVERRDGLAVALIEDDGRGFDPEAAGEAGQRLGLLGMRERVALVGGALQVESSPGAGTTVRARIPLSHDPGEPGRG
jgi:signal transduction histidine kinase